MHVYKLIAVQVLVLSSATILPAQPTILAQPLLLQQENTRKCSMLSCFKKACAVSCAALGLSGIGYGTYLVCTMNPTYRPTPQPPFPTPAPKPYHEARFHITIYAPCNDACPSFVDRQEMCIPDYQEWPSIKQQVQQLCPNSTKIRLSICNTADYTPYPPCRDVNATLQEIATTCPLKNATRAKYRTLLKKLADKRKPANLRG